MRLVTEFAVQKRIDEENESECPDRLTAVRGLRLPSASFLSRGAGLSHGVRFCHIGDTCRMDFPGIETEQVYPLHQYERDWAFDGRTCKFCGLLEGGPAHIPEPIKRSSFFANSRRGMVGSLGAGRIPSGHSRRLT